MTYSWLLPDPVEAPHIPKMGRVPAVFESPWKRCSKWHPFYAMKWETEKSLERPAPAPLPTYISFVLHFFSLLMFLFSSLSSSTQTQHINCPGPVFRWGNTLKLDGWCYWEHQSLFPSHLALLPGFYCYRFLLGTHVSLWHIRMALEIKEWDLSASKNL